MHMPIFEHLKKMKAPNCEMLDGMYRVTSIESFVNKFF